MLTRSVRRPRCSGWLWPLIVRIRVVPRNRIESDESARIDLETAPRRNTKLTNAQWVSADDICCGLRRTGRRPCCALAGPCAAGAAPVGPVPSGRCLGLISTLVPLPHDSP